MCLKQLLAYSTTCSCERLMKEMVTLVMGFWVSFETKGFILNITEHDFFCSCHLEEGLQGKPHFWK